MNPAVFTSFDPSLPFDRALRLIREAGFEIVGLGGRLQHADYTTPAGRAGIGKLLREQGLAIDSVHAPFPEGDRLFSLEEDERRESVRQVEAALVTAAELDGRIVVIHLIQPYGIPEDEVRNRMIEQGRRSVGVLAGTASRLGVVLALENGQKREYDRVLEEFLSEFDGPAVGFCYDSGHEHVQGTCFRLLEKFGRRLVTVHIHDNTGRDTHLLPREGTIDWDRFRRVFHRAGYSGNLLLESGVGRSRFKDPAAFLAEAWTQARLLCQAPE